VIPKVIESPVQPAEALRETSTPGDSLAQMRASSRLAILAWLTATMVFMGVGLALVVVVGVQRFGSIESALAYLRGESLVPDAYKKSFGTVGKDERPSVEFLLRNWTTRPIKVLGVTQSCTCLSTSDLPMVIPPNGEAILKVSSRSKSTLGWYSERLRVFTDVGQSYFVLGVQGVFR